MYRRREKASLLQSLSSVWEFLFCRLPSRSHPPVENCAPIPKMVPHSLNEQKCIGEWVRGRARALKSVTSRSRFSRGFCSPATPFSAKQNKNRDPTRSLDQVPGSTKRAGPAPGSPPCFCDRLSSSNRHLLVSNMAEARLQTPPVSRGNKKKIKS